MTGTLTWARLAYRQQRWELILVVLGVAGAAAVMLWTASSLTGMRVASPECLSGVAPGMAAPSGDGAACQPIALAYDDALGLAGNLVNAAWAAPFVMGVILGAPLVAREIDSGTAQLAWSMGGTRVGWLIRRIGFVAVFGMLLLAVIGIASQLLAAAMMPERNLAEDFAYFGRRGVPIVARGAAAVMLGMLVGALIGRVLPAMLASAVVIGLVFTGLSLAQDEWNRAEATIERFYDASGSPTALDRDALDVAFGLERPDGTFLTYAEALDLGISPNVIDDQGRAYSSEADMAAGRVLGYDARLMIPGERYGDLVVRDSAIAVFLGAGALAATALVITRRRPA